MNINKRSANLFNFAFGVLLVFNASGFFRFFSAGLGIPISIFTSFSFLINLVYIAVYYQHTVFIYRKSNFLNWLLLFLIWPILTIPYSRSVKITDILLLFFFYSLFISSIVFCLVNSLRTIKTVFGLSIIISIIGGLLSILTPEIFLPTIRAVNSSEHLSIHGRAFGFEIQANRLACNLCLMFIIWIALQKWNTNSIKISLSGIILFSFILLTGSRTGIVVSLMIVFMITLYSLRFQSTFLLRLKNYIVLGATSIIILISLANYIAIKNPEKSIALRMKWFVGMVSFDKNTMDIVSESTNSDVPKRLELQTNYIKMILKRPWGYGYKGDQYYLKSGKLIMTAHSEFLTTAFQYSIIYPFALLLLMSNFMKKKRRKSIENELGTNFILQFISVFFLLFVYAQGTLISRAFLISFAFIYCIFYYPEILTNDKK